MKSLHSSSLTIWTSSLLTATLVLFPVSLSAVSGNWDVDSGGLWSDPGNWDNGGPTSPGTSPGDVVNITRLYDEPYTSGSSRVIQLNGEYTMGSLSIGTSNGYYELKGSAGNLLIMDNDGEQAQIYLKQVSSAQSNPVYASGVNVRVTAGGLRITKEGTGSNLYFGTASSSAYGTIANTTNDLQWLTLSTLNTSTTGNFQVLSVISDGKTEDRPDAQLGLIIDSFGGTATTFVGSANTNTYSGGTILRNGYAKPHNSNAFGTGLITIGDSLTSSNIQLSTQNNGTVIANNMVVSSQASDDYSITITLPLGNSRVEYSGNVDIQRKVTFSSSQPTSHLVFSGVLSGSGHVSLTGNAGGTEISGNNSAFSGGFTMTGNSRLIIGHQNALGTGKLTLGSAQAQIPQLDASSDLRIATSNAIDWKVDIIFIGSHSLNMGDGNVELGRVSGTSTSRKVTVMDSLLGFDGVISSTNGYGLTKAGDGILELNGANSYTGATLIEAGTLQGKGSLAGNLTIKKGATLSTNKDEFEAGVLEIAGALLLETDATFQFVFDSEVAGSGGVSANGVTLDGAILQLFDLSEGTIAKNTIFTVIENTSGSAIVGTFAGVEEGSTITVGSQSFIVSYVGGTGNDLVLTAIPEPSTIALISAFSLLGVTYVRRRK
jgi:fibronectin-binding autotransporter adhesin